MPVLQPESLRTTLKSILVRNGFSESDADLCAEIFTENTVIGVASHGINRFPQFISHVQQGYIRPCSRPSLVTSSGALEQWDGNLGPGPLNACAMIDRAMAIADLFGVSCIGLRNTNHWMRGGTYGARAADKGYISICWTNTIPNLPPWGSRKAQTGNNPLVIAVPRPGSPVVLDMALSQFSYGTLATYRREGKRLPVVGGYAVDGTLTDDPAEIYASFRPLPAGLWKGTGLSLLLDLIASVLSGGKSTSDLAQADVEFGVSQVFVAVAPDKLMTPQSIESTVAAIVEYFKQAEPIDNNTQVRIPGERAARLRDATREGGIVVDDQIWQRVIQMQNPPPSTFSS